MDKRKVIWFAVGAAVLLGAGGLYYYRLANEDRELKAYVVALDELAEVLEENAQLSPGARDGKKLRKAVDKCKDESTRFAKVAPADMPKYLKRHPELERALERMNRAMAAIGGSEPPRLY